MRVYPDDPVELLPMILWQAGSAGFGNVDVGNLGEPDYWGCASPQERNDECTTAQTKHWIGFIAHWLPVSDRAGPVVVIAMATVFAARFRLRPGPLQSHSHDGPTTRQV